jgi:hypothetical protein
MKHHLVLGVGMLLFAGLLGCAEVKELIPPEMPTYPAVSKTVWLKQNWSTEQRNWYHHADQGTLTFGVPLEWFMALEQPYIEVGGAPLLSDPAYLDRFGFIPDSGETGTVKLPVGFAPGGAMPKPDGSPWLNPQTKNAMTGFGLTCAACHTGRFTYKSTEVLIDGAPALTNVDAFRTTVGLSLAYTGEVPFRFDRFADRVLGSVHSDQAKAALRADLDVVLKEAQHIHDLDAMVQAKHVSEGFTRLDALTRIGNLVFGLELNNSSNYLATTAPVHYPRIWNDSWFSWVQYNASIEQPMVRNAGEALGVGASINLTGDKAHLFQSTVAVGELFRMEQMLAGKRPSEATGFTGLNPPKWPVGVLPPIDRRLAARGAVLYREVCQGCHMAPVTSHDFWTSDRWTPVNSAGERYLDLEVIPLDHVGTDPAQAADMKARTVALPASLGINVSDFGNALGQVVGKTVERWYDSQTPPTPDAERSRMNGNRPDGIQAPLGYKVRPLNGIWATPPYLHNGSVPNLYALLSPLAERPAKFFLGGREYDPVHVGYVTDRLAGGFEFDTSIRGNWNKGHLFSNDKNAEGVIGRGLTPGERLELVEYLKTL